MELNRIICGDWIEVAKSLPEKFVHCIITSPPYWGQRNYGVEGQLGLEKTPEEHIEKLVVGFRQMRRILRDDGVVFLNYGDKYATMKGSCKNPGGGTESFHKIKKENRAIPVYRGNKSDYEGTGIKQGDLIGLAWRMALGLQADGWILRSDIIWAKAISFNDKYSGSTMPESVNGWRWERHKIKVKAGADENKKRRGDNPYEGIKSGIAGDNPNKLAQWRDCPVCEKCEGNGGYVLRRGSGRPTRAHEYLFLLAKTNNYFYDCEAVREGIFEESIKRDKYKYTGKRGAECPDEKREKPGNINEYCNQAGRNLRDVWTINPQPYPDAHYATFPEALVEPCIKAGTSAKGCCPQCGSPWAPVVENKQLKRERSADRTDRHSQGEGVNSCGNTVAGVSSSVIGWRPTCECERRDTSDERQTTPCVVYDPFMGSGTVAMVAARLGRDYLGSEISKDYIEKQAQYRRIEGETGISKAEQKAGQRSLF